MCMCNAVIVIPPHEFKQLFRWNKRMWEDKNYEFLFVIYGIMSTENFINFRPAIF
jgi:hypothetical protein